MKRVITLLAVVALAIGVLAGTALARGNNWGDVPPHGHVMLIGAHFEDGMVHFDRCVEFAKGRALRVPAHHHSVHTGAAGGSPFAPGALFNAGNWVVPLDPLISGYTGCGNFSNPWAPPG